MITKTFKATSLALVAVAVFAAAASTPVSAKGHGPVRFGGGFNGPVHGIGSSHNPIPVRHFPYAGIGRGFPHFPFPPVSGAPIKGGPKMGGPARGWGGEHRYGLGRGFGRGYGVGLGVVSVGGSVCPTHFHWSPKFLRCIPNYT